MSAELSATCRAFTLDVSEAGLSREVRGTVRFHEGAAENVAIGLSLVAQLGPQALGPGKIDAETTIASAAATVSRASSFGSFVLGLPPVAASYTGRAFRIAVALVACADDGSMLRVLLDVPTAGDAARLILRGLPKRTVLVRPGPCLTGLLAVLMGVIVAAFTIGQSQWTFSLGFLGVLFGSFFSLRHYEGLRDWLKVGSPSLRLEADSEAGELVATLEGGRGVSGGRFRLIALEYETHEGTSIEHSTITEREVSLARNKSGDFAGRVPLPKASEAPPALALRAGKRLLSIRWLARVELETLRGSKAVFSIPVHVGIEEPGHPAPG